ncbi:putative cytochrome P450 oxidoreductase GliC-like protein [Xylaria palmicola]|nr:putative cytochrome P450 oxidoreductase GliC-like protein [Xylaria palmicola]
MTSDIRGTNTKMPFPISFVDLWVFIYHDHAYELRFTGVALFLAFTFSSHSIQGSVGDLISWALNATLLFCYPIKHREYGTNLPSLPYVFPNGQGNVEKFLRGRVNSHKWECEYGSIYRLWSGMSGEVVLTKPAHIEAVFRDSHNHTKAHANDSGYLMERLLGSCLGLISGRPWSAVKSALEPPFLHKSMGRYAEDLQHFVRDYLQDLKTSNQALGQEGKLHPVRDLKCLPFLFVARVVYGQLNADLEDKLTDLLQPREDLFKSVINGGITRFYLSRFLPLPAIRALLNFKSKWAEWNDRAYRHALENTGSNDRPPIVDMYEAVYRGRITREQLLQTLDEILFANIDVTTGGLSWTLVFLAAHPVTQTALRSEICSESTNKVFRNSYLTSSWASTPTLLGACILEAARLRPLAAFSTPQACPTPRVLDGFEVPAGTNFIIDSYALNIRDSFWGADRERFHPERWLERHRSERDLRYRYWRFGFGPRTCLGKYMTELILRTIVVHILERWHITMRPTTEQPHAENKGPSLGHKNEKANAENMDWAFDDELWIHSPHLLLLCQPLAEVRR